jgi:hypothetical protein
VVSHLAGGTVATVFHLVDGKWKQASGDPREGDKYSVVHVEVKEHAVELTYKVTMVPKYDSPGSFYTYTFLFDPVSTSHTAEKRQPIDAETYGPLRLE